MRRFLTTGTFAFPRFRADAAPSESSPLIPKADPSAGDSEELTNVTAEPEQEGPKHGRYNNSSAYTKQARPSFRYSLTDYFLKYFLFLSNLMFTILGLLVLGLGVWGLISKESFAQEKIGSIGTDPMLILVSLGVVLTALCLLGSVGALRENCILLKVFSAVVLVLLSAQVLAAILAYTIQDQIRGYLRSGMLTAMARYQDDLDLRFIMDEIQTNLQCCGADDYRDWEVNIYYNCSAPGVLACGVPATCCVDPLENGTVWNSQCGIGAQKLDEFTAQTVIFLGGCLGGISRWIEQHQGLIGTTGIVVLGVQILTLFITTRLVESIQWHKALYNSVK